MEFTKTQQTVVILFKSLLKSDKQVFMLKGAVSTSKTTLVSEFLNVLKPKKRKYNLMALTGRAAYIIGSKTGYRILTLPKTC